MAASEPEEQGSEGSHECVFVRIGGRRFGLPVSSVREVLQMPEPTFVPSWPPIAWGFIDVRGELVPLVDVAPLLGQPALSPAVSQFVLVLLVDGNTWGMVVDGVDGVLSIQLRQAADRLAAGLADLPPVCQGVATDAQGSTVILGPDRLIDIVRPLLRQDGGVR